MWPFKSAKEKLTEKEYKIHVRYLSMLSSNFQRKYVEFSSICEERLKFDNVILSLHKHPRISGIIIQPKYIEKLKEKSVSFGINGIDIQIISNAVEKYDDFKDMTKRYVNILNAYGILLNKELKFYEEIYFYLNDSKGTLSSLQRVFEKEQNKKVRELVNSLISILNELKEQLLVRISLLKKIIQTYRDVAKYNEFQTLIRQNVFLDEGAMKIYTALFKQKEQLPIPLKKRINDSIKNIIPQKSSLAASFLLSITLLANACDEVTPLTTEHSKEITNEIINQDKPNRFGAVYFSISNDGFGLYTVKKSKDAVNITYSRANEEEKLITTFPLNSFCRLFAGKEVYLYKREGNEASLFVITPNSATPLNSVVPVKNVPPDRVLQTIQGDVLFFRAEETLLRLVKKPNSNTLVKLEGIDFSNTELSGRYFQFFTTSADGKTFASSTETRDGNYALTLGELSPRGPGKLKTIDTGSFFDVKFDSSGKFLAYAKTPADENELSKSYIVIYDILQNKKIFETVVQTSSEEMYIKFSWDESDSVLVFSSLDEVRYIYVNSIKITQKGVGEIKKVASKILPIQEMFAKNGRVFVQSTKGDLNIYQY